jgi:tetratricopeptide (TPR) repeat protein
MKTPFPIASVFIPTLFSVSLAATQAPQAPQAANRAATPFPNPPLREKRTAVFDLLSAGAEPSVIAVPRGENFSVVLKNRAPSGSYRVTYDWTLAPTTMTRPPAGALHRTYELQKPFESQLRQLNISPACTELQSRANEVVTLTDERELASRLAAFRTKNADHACPQLTHLESTVSSLVDPELVPSYTLYEGDELRYTLERMVPGSAAAVKTWRFTVRAEALRLGWAYPNEEAWIVGETARDIVEMMVYARDRSLPPPATLGFSVTANAASAASPTYTVAASPSGAAPQKQVLTFETYVWSPANYEPLASGLIRSLALRPAPASAEGLVAEALINPTSHVLAQESRRLSQRLEQTMLDAGAHEQAALILGTLALREASGGFNDPRQELCRMSAHLTVARALRHGATSSMAGHAEALLLTLVNRQRDALSRVEMLDRGGSTSAWAAFRRALRIRNTRDWRILKAPAKATLLERLEHFRALEESLGSSQAMAFLETFQPEPMGDWGRIGLQAGATVEQGQAFAASMIPVEMGEALDVWQVLNGKQLASDRIIEVLNARPSRLVTPEAGGKAAPRVIGWGTWARFFQRNVAFGAEASSKFLERSLGLKDDARQLRDSLNQTFSGLDFWPALALQWLVPSAGAPAPATGGTKDDGARRDACARGVKLVHDAPELVSAHVWVTVDNQCAEERQKQILPPMARWFVRLAPAGTALMELERIAILMAVKVDPTPVFAGLHELAPVDPRFLQAIASDGPEPTFEKLAQLYGPLADYDLHVMERLAATQRTDPAALRALYEKIAAIEPAKYLELGNYLVDLGLPDEAVAAYEKAIEGARDRVRLSNNLMWLVGYYVDHARLDRARELARLAADVYSEAGLETMGYFQERMGRYAEAEEWYRKIIERYGQKSAEYLEDFYIRYEQRVGDGRFAAGAAAALAKVFPAGLERVSLFEFTSPPLPGEGVRVSGQFQRTTRLGLIKDDVVVALNGFRIHDHRQYQLVWTFSDRPEATVIVWRQGRYIEVKGRLERMAYGPVSRPI